LQAWFSPLVLETQRSEFNRGCNDGISNVLCKGSFLIVIEVNCGTLRKSALALLRFAALALSRNGACGD